MIRGTYVRGDSAVSVVINNAEREPAISIEQGVVAIEDLTLDDEIKFNELILDKVRESSNSFMAMVRNYIATTSNIGGTR